MQATGGERRSTAVLRAFTPPQRLASSALPRIPARTTPDSPSTLNSSLAARALLAAPSTPRRSSRTACRRQPRVPSSIAIRAGVRGTHGVCEGRCTTWGCGRTLAGLQRVAEGRDGVRCRPHSRSAKARHECGRAGAFGHHAARESRNASRPYDYSPNAMRVTPLIRGCCCCLSYECCHFFLALPPYSAIFHGAPPP